MYKKVLLKVIIITILLYAIICGLLYLGQEKLIFFPEKLAKDYKFSFYQKFEEININASDEKLLNGILFKSDSSKGLIFYLHGNAGSLKSWGEVAATYHTSNYDVFMLDYRGYGKSDGEINNQQQLFQDVQLAYEKLKTRYAENKIIVLGYSLGTGLATKLASANNPKLLILQAPYFSLIDMMNHNFRIIPSFILKYKLETNKYLTMCKMPVVIFHGINDEVIYYNSSEKLKTLFKPTDTLITLKGQGHNRITDNPQYQLEVSKILAR